MSLFREPLDEAIDRPRWVLGPHLGRRATALRIEPRFDGNLIDALASAGHDVEVLAGAYSDVMGHAGAAVLHPDGTWKAPTIRAPMAGRRGCSAYSPSSANIQDLQLCQPPRCIGSRSVPRDALDTRGISRLENFVAPTFRS